MLEIYGRPLVERLGRSNPGSCFSKTSPDSQETLPGFGELPDPWKIWATALRRDYGARRSAARTTAASGASSWPTATLTELGNSPASYAAMKDSMTTGARKAVTELSQAARLWPLETWPTVVALDGAGFRGDAGPNRHAGETLTDAVQSWATPVAKDANGPTSNHRDLCREASIFPGTPSVETPSELGQLSQVLAQISYPQLPSDGKSSGGRKLNPAFAAWLMGWPPEWTDSVPPETEWTHWWQRTRSSLFGLLSMAGRVEVAA
ncbi:MAG: hypothetical protein AAF604_04470 [Acidobacteriota bacterium]